MFLGSNNPEIGPIYKFENEDTIDGLPLVSKSILFFWFKPINSVADKDQK